MEMPTQSRRGADTVDASIESTLHPSLHPSWRRNLLASTLLRLPTELILEIFVHAIGSDDEDYSNYHRHDRTLFVLTAICRQLREIGTTSPQLWNCIDFTILPIAELFLERCNYNPRILLINEPGPGWSPRIVPDPRREAVWRKLEGWTFNDLRSLVFRGTEREFALRVVSVLQRAPNVSNLDLANIPYHSSQELPWPIGDPIPNLSSLRLHNFFISWTSPLLRDLTRLTLGSEPPRPLPERVPVEAFLTALANCPHLELLNLTHTGPEPLSDRQDKCDVVVQLCRLRKFSLKFRDPSTVGYVLSHIGYPESTRLAVYVPSGVDTDLPEMVSRLLLHRNVQAIQHFRKSTALTIHLDDHPQFSTNNLLVRFQGSPFHLRRSPQELVGFTSKIVEVVGGDTMISLDIELRVNSPPDGLWEVLLHGLPQLERICYRRKLGGRDRYLIESFIKVFSRPFEGRAVCPQLQYLQLPRAVLTQHSSATVLKRALTERVASGRRLKRIGISDDEAEVGDWLVLEPFRDLINEAG